MRGLWVAVFLLGVSPPSGAFAESVDLELVIAIDVSSSVDEEEYRLQTRGIAAAFRNPVVLDAIRTLGPGGIAVAVVQWSDNHEQVLVSDWMVIRDEADAARLSRSLRRTSRAVPGGQTSISGAIEFSLELLATNDYEGVRQVIDVSGDGRANTGLHPMGVRDHAVELGVTINGLAILNEEPFLDGYFEHSVIGGTGAFLMVADDYRDFAAAILQKLLREIGLPVARRDGDGGRFAFRPPGAEDSLRPDPSSL